ncbi:MAG: response regulator [Myxococcaceae bacterium]|nr:response regulator [Myxococcaceae bacterium]
MSARYSSGDVVRMNGCQVLVVDDEEANRDLLSGALEQEGYAVSTAENGAAAMSLLEGGLDPDLILTDLMMPVMSGWDFCTTLKARPQWRSIPVVVLCGMSPEQRGKLKVEGAFEKPTDLPILFRRIAELCGI